ncbi:MAG: MGMT family protein [Pseudomonadota bacterium]
MFQPEPNTAFRQRVWDFVRSIPCGRVVSYGQIARAVGPNDGDDPHAYQREGARWVGAALAKCPTDVPWHRVVNSRGKVTYQAAAQQQHALLVLEGIHLTGGVVDMRQYQWLAHEDQTAPAQHSLF